MDIARDICTDSFYIVNSGLPCIAVTAVSQVDMPLLPLVFSKCISQNLFLKMFFWQVMDVLLTARHAPDPSPPSRPGRPIEKSVFLKESLLVQIIFYQTHCCLISV